MTGHYCQVIHTVACVETVRQKSHQMKLIIKNTDTEELYILKNLLESNGIPVFISGEDTARVLPFLMSKPGLWIFLDEQYDEALKLINDPAYEVSNKIDIDEFYEAAHDSSRDSKSLNSTLAGLALFMGLLILVLFIVINILQWLQS